MAATGYNKTKAIRCIAIKAPAAKIGFIIVLILFCKLSFCTVVGIDGTEGTGIVVGCGKTAVPLESNKGSVDALALLFINKTQIDINQII